MNRECYINIAGKNYPMRFSLMASIQMSNKFGSMEKMADKITGKGKKGGEANSGEVLESMLWILEILIKQGCAYKNYFEADIPVPPDAPAVDGKYIPLDSEQLAVGLEMSSMSEISEKIFEAMGLGGKTEVKTKEKETKNKKNEETT